MVKEAISHEKVRDEMDKYIARDDVIVNERMNMESAVDLWRRYRYNEKRRLLEGRPIDEEIEIANVHNYRGYMYCKLLPSTGYINLYDIRPYRNGLLLRLPNALHNHTIPKYRDDDKLYEAYAESKRMRRYTGIEYLADMNEKIRDGSAADVIKSSEWLASRELEEFAGTILEEKKKVVLIAGPSSSGKTTTAKRICQEIKRLSGTEPLYLGTDDYFVERADTPIGEDGKPDFEGLGAVDLDLFNKQMEDLLAGKEVDIPEFDFKQGSKIFGRRITKLEKDQVLVIEGIHSLNDVLTENVPRSDKFKIYISPLTQIAIDRHNRISTADARLLRRMAEGTGRRKYEYIPLQQFSGRSVQFQHSV